MSSVEIIESVIEAEGTVTSAKIADITKYSKRTVSNALITLQEIGKVKCVRDLRKDARIKIYFPAKDQK